MRTIILRVIKQHRLLLSLPLIVIAIGTAGFMVIEHLSFIDALYFTIVTISTVGYGDIHPVSAAGKLLCIVLIIIGIGTFLSIVTRFTQSLVQRSLNRLRRHKLNMLIGVFFTEIGDQLLRYFISYDHGVESVKEEFLIDNGWTGADFNHLRRKLQKSEFGIDSSLLDLAALKGFLLQKGEILIRLIENPDILEFESFTELLWAIIHLRDELMARHTLVDLPETDVGHLANDAKRAYNLLVRQWLQYLQHLKQQYPYLFSLALRTNPFSENPSSIVK
jgi:voltage-gated potassium channel